MINIIKNYDEVVFFPPQMKLRSWKPWTDKHDPGPRYETSSHQSKVLQVLWKAIYYQEPVPTSQGRRPQPLTAGLWWTQSTKRVSVVSELHIPAFANSKIYWVLTPSTNTQWPPIIYQPKDGCFQEAYIPLGNKIRLREYVWSLNCLLFKWSYTRKNVSA